MAEIKPFAVLAFLREIGFQQGKSAPDAIGEHFFISVRNDVAQLPLGVDKEITGINISIMFHEKIRITALRMGAGYVGMIDVVEQNVFKGANGHVPESVSKPCIEEIAVEFTQSVPGDRKRQALFGKGIPLHTGYELQVRKSLLSEKPVQLNGLGHAGLGQKAQDVEPDPALFQQIGSLHDEIEGTFPRAESSVTVMNVAGSVEAQTDQKAIPGKEAGPGFIDKCSIGLKSIDDDLSRSGQLCLKFHNLSKEVEAEQARFSPLPAELALSTSEGECPADELACGIESHEAALLRIDASDPLVEAIPAAHVAVV